MFEEPTIVFCGVTFMFLVLAGVLAWVIRESVRYHRERKERLT